MSKIAFAALTAALVVTGSSLVYAQAPLAGERTQGLLSEADSKALTDRRIAVVKYALNLTADQAKYWPAVEEAIRARATARHDRLAKLVARHRAQGEVNPVDLMHERADALAQRAMGLKKLADAWQPLYASLDPDQKQRLRILAVYVLREMRDAVESRRMQSEDEEEDE